MKYQVNYIVGSDMCMAKGSGIEVGDEDEVERGTNDCEAVIKKKRADGDDANKCGGGGEENES
jgi:hypothetical protein